MVNSTQRSRPASNPPVLQYREVLTGDSGSIRSCWGGREPAVDTPAPAAPSFASNGEKAPLLGGDRNEETGGDTDGGGGGGSGGGGGGGGADSAESAKSVFDELEARFNDVGVSVTTDATRGAPCVIYLSLGVFDVPALLARLREILISGGPTGPLALPLYSTARPFDMYMKACPASLRELGLFSVRAYTPPHPRHAPRRPVDPWCSCHSLDRNAAGDVHEVAALTRAAARRGGSRMQLSIQARPSHSCSHPGPSTSMNASPSTSMNACISHLACTTHPHQRIVMCSCNCACTDNLRVRAQAATPPSAHRQARQRCHADCSPQPDQAQNLNPPERALPLAAPNGFASFRLAWRQPAGRLLCAQAALVPASGHRAQLRTGRQAAPASAAAQQQPHHASRSRGVAWQSADDGKCLMRQIHSIIKFRFVCFLHVVERAWANRSTVGGALGSRSLI